MARIFNIYFYFDGLMYNATVSERSTPFFTEYTLNNFNEELKSLLPGNKIILTAPENYIFQNASPENSAVLMNAILKAVTEHLNAKKAPLL